MLIAEDSYLVAEALTLAIEDAGGIVIAAENDATRLDKLIELAPFDCALLDIGLRNGSSLAAASKLKRAGKPFLFITGYGREVLPRELSDAPLLQKPGPAEDILRALEAHLALAARAEKEQRR